LIARFEGFSMSNFKLAAPPGPFRFAARLTTTVSNRSGWTEAGWLDPTAAPDLLTARTVAGQWGVKRRAMMLDDSSITSIRVWSTMQTYRGAGLLTTSGTGPGTYTPSAGSAASLNPNIKLLTHQQNAGLPAQGVSEFLGAVPDNVITADGHYVPDGNFTTAWNNYVAWLIANANFVRKNVSPPHDVTPFAIQDVQIFSLPRRRSTGRTFPIDHALDMRG
jgi:hypothetical protein